MPTGSAIRPLLGLTVAGACLGTLPSAAHAVSVTTVNAGTTTTVRQINEPASASADTENQNLSITQDAAGTLLITGTNQESPMAADAPCFLVSAATVGCPARPSNDSTLEVSTGIGNDQVTVSLPERNAAGIVGVDVAGGGGNDILRGGPLGETLRGDGRKGNGQTLVPDLNGVILDGNDVLFGAGGGDTLFGNRGNDYLAGNGAAGVVDAGNTLNGDEGADYLEGGDAPAADVFNGGANGTIRERSLFVPGRGTVVTRDDTVGYATRTFPAAGPGVTADIDGVADDGATGEGDTIATDVESIDGSIRDDKLTGSAGVNALTGNLGVDKLSGLGAADEYFLRDGVQDTCPTLSTGDIAELDLVDPTVESCTPTTLTLFTLLPSLTVNRKPVDEKIAFVTLGTARTTGGRVSVAVTCQETKRTCAGSLRLSAGITKTVLARAPYRVRAGRTRTVRVPVSAAVLRTLRAARLTRIAAVAQGTSRKGRTTVLAHRRL